MRRSLLVVVVGLAALLGACLPQAPAQPAPDTAPPEFIFHTPKDATTSTRPGSTPPVDNSPSTPVAGANAFDTCAAPSNATMTSWKSASPFNTIGVYIGGANKGCAQPNLTSGWVSTVAGQGWKLLPLWVGPQASCTTLHGTTKISTDVIVARAQGNAEANAAADAGNALGFTWLTPIYYDMEAYTRGGICTGSLQSFTNGWVETLHARGYRAAFYSSLCSGVQDQALSYNYPGFLPLDAIWIAAWNDTPNLFGFTGTCALADSYWPNHQRIHQFKGGHNETWGAVKLNIDSDTSDGPGFGG